MTSERCLIKTDAQDGAYDDLAYDDLAYDDLMVTMWVSATPKSPKSLARLTYPAARQAECAGRSIVQQVGGMGSVRVAAV